MKSQNLPVPEALNEYICDGTPERIALRYASLRDAAEQADYGMFDNNLVVIDTETTGLSYKSDELIEIAAARVEQGHIVDWYVTFVNPGKNIPDDISHLTSITNEMVADAPTPEEALQGLVEFAGDATMVAHNAEFDYTFVTKHPAGYPLIGNLWIDSLDLARIAFPRLKSHRLLDLGRAFERPRSTHRADADVAATCAVLRIMLAAIDAMPSELTAHIADIADENMWPTVAVFKYFAARNAEAGCEQKRFSLRDLRTTALAKPVAVDKEDAEEIAADPLRDLVFPEADEVAAAFSETGLMADLYENYEERPEQQQMAEAVRAAFMKSRNLCVEAGTGVGKSMAYLVPAVMTARANNITVGIATKTNALLDQLVFHELPALAEAFPGLTYAPLKGFSHYPCLRRIDRLASEPAEMREVAGREVCTASSIAALLSFIEQTEYDDLDSLKINYRAVPRRSITTTSHDCLRRKCPFYGVTCFVHGARRRAEKADIVVTNHSLLFCDLAVDNGLLPPIRYWIIDEAHGAEAEARRAFSLSLDANELLRLANRVSSDEASRSPFVRAERRVVASDDAEKNTLFYALTAKARAAGKVFAQVAEEFVAHMKDLLFFDETRKGAGYEYVDLWLNEQIRGSATFGAVREHNDALRDAAEKLTRCCQDLVAYLDENDQAADVQRDIAVVAIALKEILQASEVVFGPQDERYAYSATLNRKKDRVGETYEALMVNVGESLNDTLYARTHSVIFASATMAVDNDFQSFEQAMGLNTTELSQTDALLLGSSYDFDTNMTVFVANDIPEPNDPAYLGQLQQLLIDTHLAQQGSMLTLFTNRKEMERCFDEVNPSLKEHDLRLVCQKWGVSVKGLRDDFIADEHLSLFALKSFWEGFDAPGNTLKGVIIPKLPFAKPSDPLSCERAARDDNAWRHYVLPAAVIETKQAAGRLIRTATDTGVLILADRRLLTKNYGKTFLRSLPSQNIHIMSCVEIAEQLANMAGNSPAIVGDPEASVKDSSVFADDLANL